MLTVQFGIVYFERADADIGFTSSLHPIFQLSCGTTSYGRYFSA